jgi:hypothetical protein
MTSPCVLNGKNAVVTLWFGNILKNNLLASLWTWYSYAWEIRLCIFTHCPLPDRIGGHGYFLSEHGDHSVDEYRIPIVANSWRHKLAIAVGVYPITGTCRSRHWFHAWKRFKDTIMWHVQSIISRQWPLIAHISSQKASGLEKLTLYTFCIRFFLPSIHPFQTCVPDYTSLSVNIHSSICSW